MIQGTHLGGVMSRELGYLGRASSCSRHGKNGLAKTFLGLALAAPVIMILGGCQTLSGGPDRLYTVDEEVQIARDTLKELESGYYQTRIPSEQKFFRDEYISRRMYIIDVEYSKYEGALTSERQAYGFFGAITTQALTTGAAVFTPQSTIHALSGLAGGVNASKGFYDAELLLAKTIQIAQGHMRADRDRIAAKILIQQQRSTQEYPLSAALHDLEDLYRAGTLTAGLIDAVGTASVDADIAAAQKSNAQGTPILETSRTQMLRGANAVTANVITDVRRQLPAGGPRLPKGPEKEKRLASLVEATLCVPSTKQPTDQAIRDFLIGMREPGIDPKAESVTITPKFQKDLDLAVAAIPNCKTSPWMNAFEVGRFGMSKDKGGATIKTMQGVLRTNLNISSVLLPDSGKLDKETRKRIQEYREKNKLAPELGTQVDAALLAQMIN